MKTHKITQFIRSGIQKVRLRTWIALGLILIIIPIVVIALTRPSAPSAVWYNTEWSSRKLITIDAAQVAGSADHTDFPVLVSITDSDLAADAQADGDDILFTASDGVTQLDHEIESYNSGTGVLVAWVRIPTLDYDNDTTFYMYFGNSSASSQQNATGVWDSNYLGVWHMEETSTNTVADSTTNANHGTNNGATETTSSSVGYALDFNSGETDYVDIGAMNTLDGLTGITWEIYANVDNTANDHGLFARGGSGTLDLLLWRDENTSCSANRTDTFSFLVMNSVCGTAERVMGASSSWNDTNYHYLVAVYDGSGPRLRGYLDGTEDPNSPAGTSSPSTYPSSSDNIWIGARGGTTAYNLDGKVTEARISTTIRSADWISTTYNNLNAPGTFLTVGSLDENATTDVDWFNSSWEYRKAISIAHPSGTSVTEYQVLIDGLDTASLVSGTKLQSDCDDIRFTASDGTTELDYSIVGNTCNTSDTEIWVQVDAITSSGTTIYLYYGNSGATAGNDEAGTFSYSSAKTVAYVASDAFVDLDVISLEDGNSVTHNGDTQALDEGDTYAYTVDAFGEITATKLFNGGDTASAADVVSPISWASTEFLVRTRQGASAVEDEFHVISPWGTASVRLYADGVEQTSCGSPWSVTSSGSSLLCDVSGDVNLRLVSDIPILAMYEGNTQDAMNVYPATTEYLYGIPSQRYALSAGPNGADYRYIFSDEASETNPTNLGANSGTNVNNSEADFTEKPARFYSATASGPIGVKQLADGDGSEATTFVRRIEFGTKFGSVGTAEWVAFLSDQGAQCSVYNVGSGTPIETETLTTSNSTPSVYGHPNANDFGTGSDAAYTSGAWIAECTEPSYAYFDEDTSNGERNTWTYPMMRQYTYPDPNVSALGTEEDYTTWSSAQATPTPTPAPAIPDPAVYWQFDEQQGQTANDSSVNSTNATLGGSTSVSTDDPAWRTKADCKINGCLDFDGGDYVQTATGVDLTNTSFTATAWAKRDGIGQGDIIFGQGTQSTREGLHFGFRDSNQFTCALYSDDIDSDATYTDTDWHHWACVYDADTNSFSLYRDGRFVEAHTTSGDYIGTGTFYIGRTGWGDSYFNGNLDEIKIYTAALTADEIKVDMNAHSNISFGVKNEGEASQIIDGAGNPPVVYWTMDENADNTCTGGTNDVCDKSGNGNDGPKTNMSSSNWVPGKFGTALNFDGSDDYLTLSDSAIDTSQAHTMSIWFKASSFTSGDGLGGDWVGNDLGVMFYFQSNNLCAYINNTEKVCTTSFPSTNVWHNAQYVYNASTISLYLDGMLIGSTAAGTADGGTIYIGEYNNSTATTFPGQIDELKIYSYARTPAQIAYDYNRGAPIAHWQFDECTGTTAYDASGNGNNGTITIAGTGSHTSAGTCGSGTGTHAWNAGTNGRIQGSLGFDGTDDQVGASGVTIGTSDFTVMAWIKNSTGTTTLGIVNYEGTVRFRFDLSGTDSRLRYGIYSSSAWAEQTDNSTYDLSDDEWHHVAVTFDRDGNASSYVDGELKYATLDISGKSSASISSGTTRIGYDNFSSGSYFSGQIDDVRIYNYLVSADQIRKIMNDNSGVRFN